MGCDSLTTEATVYSPTGAQKVLLVLLEYWRETSFSYVITNSYENLQTEVSSDVDGMIDQSALPLELVESARSAGIDVLQMFQRESNTYVFVLATDEYQGRGHYLWLDIGSDFRQQGRVFYDSRDVIPTSREFRGIKVPAPAVEFGLYLTKKIVQRRLTAENGDRLSQLYRMDPTGCDLQIDRFWGSELSCRIKESAKSGDWSRVRTEIKQLRRELYGRRLRRDPAQIFRYWFPEWLRKLRRNFQPSGLHIVFLGPDGAGKTTIINHIEESLAGAFRGTLRHHLFPGLRHRVKGVQTLDDPHALPERSLFGSLAKICYWVAEFTLGYYLHIRPKLVRSTLVLSDRYYADIIADPTRYRYGGPQWVSRTVGKMLPKPDLVILLDAPAEILHQRKQEVALAEVRRQRTAYRELVESMSNGHIVDASQPIEQVAASVSEIALSFLAHRLHHRLRIPVSS
jgi:thymidylate kinase